ncbi:MAG TPA: hypothetical protein PLV55_13650 [Anaerohalosphaeraceae bacterium]|nr:hypothetical protein [Anaerohalosphaeraceae bacterium]HOL90118.1 hypothetical protein [Anaerohalosphaeraceae bacterium]
MKAVPTNMREEYALAVGGVLYFIYAWDSTTGDLNDLGNCVVGEWVLYDLSDDPYCWPLPWLTCTPNPTVIALPATEGVAQDTHSCGTICPPLQEAQFVAYQNYWYRCDVPCCMKETDYELLLPIGPIIRKITRESLTGWLYWITKSGKYAELVLE